jgi:hypothetical protein
MQLNAARQMPYLIGFHHQNSGIQVQLGPLSREGLDIESSGAACKAGFSFFPIKPFSRLSIAAMTHSATSLSAIPSGLLSVVLSPSASPSSSASRIAGGFVNPDSQACRKSIAYVGRSLGILFKQPRTKSRAASENSPCGRSGGSPSTMAYTRSVH